MAMTYSHRGIPLQAVPAATVSHLQHLLDTYASETNKVGAVWSCFTNDDLAYTPHSKSSSVEKILSHQLLSERRFFAEFLGLPEPPADQVLPNPISIEACVTRLEQLALARLPILASQPIDWWTTEVPFFDVRRERIWVFWRRVLHTAHHRTQLTLYLRLLDRAVPATYGPTADVTWSGADPTLSVAAASRRQL